MLTCDMLKSLFSENMSLNSYIDVHCFALMSLVYVWSFCNRLMSENCLDIREISFNFAVNINQELNRNEYLS